MDLDRQNYSLVRNFFYCVANLTVVADGEFSTPAIHKQMKRWTSGQTAPTKASLLEMTRLMPYARNLINRSSHKRGGPFRPHIASFVNYRPLKDSVFLFEDSYFPFLACFIEYLGMILLSNPQVDVPQDILLPDPYRTVYLDWRSLDEEQRKHSTVAEHRLRTESLLLLLAIREAGLEPPNRIMLKTFKWLCENRQSSQESCKAAFFRMKKCRYPIWKELASKEWLRNKHAGKPRTDDLEGCYDRGKFYSRLKQPWHDRIFLTEVFGAYYDCVLKRTYDADEREMAVDFLLVTFFQVATLDWQFSHHPPKCERLSDQEVVHRLESYIEFVIKVKQSPDFAPDVVDSVDTYWETQFQE